MGKFGAFLSKIHFPKRLSKSSEDQKIEITIAKDSETKQHLSIIRFDEECRSRFKFWRFAGLCPVEWDDEKCEYIPKTSCFVAFYAFVSFIILFCTLIAILKSSSDSEKLEANVLFHTMVFIFSTAVVPSFQAYCTKLFYTNLPKLLVRIGHLTYLTREHRPIIEMKRELFTFNLLTRKRKEEIEKLKLKEKLSIDDVAYLLPKCTIFVSIASFAIVSIFFMAASSLNRDCLKDWKIFLELMTTGSFFPICISSFTITVFSWMKTTYEALKIKLKTVHDVLKNHTTSEESEIILDDKLDEVLRELSLLHSTTQEIYMQVLKFPMSISIFTFVVIGMICFVIIMQDYSYVLLFIPMFTSFHFTLMLCYGGERVLQQVRKTPTFQYLI